MKIFLSRSKTIIEMSNFRKNETGLPFNCYLAVEPRCKHSPRIKVQQDYGNKVNLQNCCSVTISNNPKIIAGSWKLDNKDFQKLQRYIILNLEHLLDIWNDEVSALERKTKLKKIED